MRSQCGAFKTCLAALIAIQHGLHSFSWWLLEPTQPKVGGRKQYQCLFIYFPFISLSKLPISVFYITFSIMLSGLTMAACSFEWDMIVLKVLPSLVKDAFICKLSSCFNQSCFTRKRCECNTLWKRYVLWNSQKSRKRQAAKWD